MTTLDIKTAAVFEPFYQPARYKIARGGRGSSKSHDRAGALIDRCIDKRVDAVCLREVQKTLDQSVKKLLEAKIEEYKVGHLFEIQANKIKTPHGGIIIFQGMQDHTADSIKSLEGYDIALFEEAQTMSQRSLDLLRPTIRKDDSEIWFIYNPDQETDPIDKFAAMPPPSTIVVTANYFDNPWFPKVLRDEMEWDKAHDYDKYLHVWEGKYNLNSNKQVFKNWRVEDFNTHDGAIFRLGADWGFSIDPSVLIRCYIIGRCIYVDYEAYMLGCEIVNLPELFMQIPDSEKWPITADSARPETISYMQKNGFPRIRAAIKGPRSLEEGVNWLQSYEIVVHSRCKHVIDELKQYSFKVDSLTNDVLPILADKDNHCLAEGTLVTTIDGNKPIETITTGDRVLTRKGYKRVLAAWKVSDSEPVFEVQSSAYNLLATGNHKIWTANKGFIMVDALSYNDELIIHDYNNLCQIPLNTITGFTGAIPTAKIGQIGCITKAAQFICTVKYGATITAIFPKNIISTISTMIQGTIALTTLSVYQSKIILESGTNGMMSDLAGKKYTLKPSGHLLKHGTQAMKAEKSTLKSVDWLIKALFRLKNNVFSALNNSPLKNLAAWIGFVPTNVRRRTEDQAELTTKAENVKNAANHSSLTDTHHQKFVQGRVLCVKDTRLRKAVYDLTIEDEPEFFANGILVHNCVDALRYACEGARRAKPTAIDKPVFQAPKIQSPRAWMGS